MRRDAVSRIAHVGTVGTNGLEVVSVSQAFVFVRLREEEISNLVKSNQIWIVIIFFFD